MVRGGGGEVVWCEEVAGRWYGARRWQGKRQHRSGKLGEDSGVEVEGPGWRISCWEEDVVE